MPNGLQKIKLVMKHTVAVIGLGFVGLPLAVLLKKKNVKIYGFDSNEKIIENIKKGISHISDLSNKQVSILKNENIYSLKNINQLNKVNFIIICLPTPLKNKKPEM